MRRRALLMGGQSIKKPSLYWKFDVDQGKYFAGRILTAINSELINYSSGKLDNAVFFTGNRTGYRGANVGSGLDVWDSNGDLPFSFSVWLFKVASNGTSGITFFSIKNTIIGVTGVGTSSTAWAIGIDSETDQVILYLRDAVNGTRTIKSVSPISRDSWQLVQILYDGAGNARIFINNLEEGSLDITDTGYVSMKNSDPYGIGISAHSQANYSNITFIGGIDDMAFWNGHLLSERERSAIWNDGIGRRIRN